MLRCCRRCHFSVQQEAATSRDCDNLLLLITLQLSWMRLVQAPAWHTVPHIEHSPHVAYRLHVSHRSPVVHYRTYHSVWHTGLHGAHGNHGPPFFFLHSTVCSWNNCTILSSFIYCTHVCACTRFVNASLYGSTRMTWSVRTALSGLVPVCERLHHWPKYLQQSIQVKWCQYCHTDSIMHVAWQLNRLVCCVYYIVRPLW